MKQRAFAAIILCGLLAGTSGLFIKEMSSMTPGSLAFFRTLVPSVILFLWILTQGLNVFRGSTKKMLFASGINAIRIYFYLMAFIYTSIGNAVILFYTWPIFVTIISVFWLKEKVSRSQLAFLLMAFAGLVISYSDKAFTFGDQDLIGMLAALAASFFYSITVITFKTESQNFHRYEIIFYQNLVGAFVFIPFFYQNYSAAAIGDIGLAIGYAIFIGIGVFGLFFYALKELTASTTSSMMYLEVVSAIILGALVLGEVLSPYMIVGGAMILIASYALNRIAGRQ